MRIQTDDETFDLNNFWRIPLPELVLQPPWASFPLICHTFFIIHFVTESIEIKFPPQQTPSQLSRTGWMGWNKHLQSCSTFQLGSHNSLPHPNRTRKVDKRWKWCDICGNKHISFSKCEPFPRTPFSHIRKDSAAAAAGCGRTDKTSPSHPPPPESFSFKAL